MESGTRVYSLNRIFGFHKREREREWEEGGRKCRMFAKFSNRNHFRRFFSRFRIEKYDKQLLIGTTMRRESLNEKKKKKTPNHRQTVDNTENQHKSSHHSLPTFLIDFLPAFLFGRVDFSHRFYLTRTHFQPNFSISMRVILRASIHFAVQLTRSRRLSISRSFHLHRFYFIHFYCFSTLAYRAIFHHSKLISF